MEGFKTLKQMASDQFVVQKSRFIGYASPVNTEEDALQFLQSIRQKHRDATHNCYAYIIGANRGIQRFSDDGEPGGTAGLPIMEVLNAKEVVNCCVVVTRYFGGILLGAGGLVRAYSHGCAIALNAAQVVRMEKSQRMLFEVPYPMWDKVLHHAKSQPVLLEDTAFTTAVQCTLLIREKDEAAFIKLLQTLTDGRINLCTSEELLYAWPASELE